MSRLPVLGSDNDTWGAILNDFLTVEHNTDGTLKASGSLATKADDSSVVHTTGNEAIAGTKTFQSSPVIPAPTLGSHATTKIYVDSAISAGAPDATTTNKGVVQLAGDLSGTATSPTVPALTSKVNTNTTITAGIGLAGGGNLSVNRTLSANFGTTSGTITQGNDSRVTGAVQSSTATTKGDLLVATAANTIIRVGVGSDTQVLTADSTQSAGVKWAAFTDASAVHKGDIVINVKDYGAKGDGGTDDTAAIAAAVTAVGTNGQVYFPAGVYITATITLPSGVWLTGAGYEATVIKLKAGANSHLVATKNFASLTGTDTPSAGVPFNFGIMNMTLDGNKSANPSGGNGVAIYGYSYLLQNIIIRNANSWGIWTEWAMTSLSPGNDSMEAFVVNFKVHDCVSGGVSHKGPHDSQFINGILYNNGAGLSTVAAFDMPVDGKANGSTLTDIHIWGGTYSYGYRVASAGIIMNGCQGEGGLVAQVLLVASLNQIIASKFFDGGVNTSTTKGIVLGTNVNNCHIAAKVENCGGGALDISASGINANDFDIIASYYGGATTPSPAVLGSYDSQSSVKMLVLDHGTATSDSTWITPGAIANAGFAASKSWGGGVGVNIQPSSNDALLLRTTADTQSGIVVFPNSATQSANLIRVQDSSFTDRFTVSMDGVTKVGAKNGLTAITFGGYKSSVGAPATGTWAVADIVIDSAGAVWICTVAGTPGTWAGG